MTIYKTRNLGDIIAEIKMSMTVFNGGYLLVEGPSDSRFFNHHISRDDCQIVICGNKNIVIDVAKNSRAKCGVNALGVVDDDFDSALGINHQSPDVVSTETHDLETEILSSRALNRVINEFADLAKITNLEVVEKRKFLDSLIYRALPFGKLRFINAENNLNVNFAKYFSPWKFFNHTTWQLDELALIEEFAKQSNLAITRVNTLYSSIPKIPHWNLIQGHDTVDILAIAFTNVIKGSTSPNTEDICSALRLAYDSTIFSATIFYQEICQWEANVTQRILCK